jgi:prolyl 4-hydroxylase
MTTQAITTELRDWIIAQARAGCRPEDVLQSMRASGWDEDTAMSALETTLEQFLQDHAKANTLPPPVGLPISPARPAWCTHSTATCRS